MNNNEIEIEIGKLVTAMAAMFPSVQVSEATINGYVNSLKVIPFATLTVAIEQVLDDAEFFPSAAQIKKKAFELSLSPDNDGNGMTKWGDVKEQFRVAGFYRRPKFTDPLVAQAVDILGWPELCSSENETADRAHFAKIYDDLKARQIKEARLSPRAKALRELNMKEIGDGNN